MERKFSKIFIIVSTVIGAILGVLEEYGYKSGVMGESRIPYIVTYLFVFVFIMGVILLFKGLRNGTFVNFGKVMAITLIATVGFIGFSGLFEFLYEMGGDKPRQFNASELQYVYLIDDSSSMNGNDPRDQRYAAVESIINDMTPTDQFAVYLFAGRTLCTTPMGSINSENYTFDNPNTNLDGSQTKMITAIRDALNDVGGNRGKHTKVIVLTDGAPSDSSTGRYNDLVKLCLQENASVSSIGFGSPNETFLEKLAENTGGMYVRSDDLDSLKNNIETVVNAAVMPLEKNRDLLGYRLDFTSDSVLYALMRVFFLIALGFIWSIIKMLLVGEKKFTYFGGWTSVILCAIAAILCEVLMLFGVNDTMVRIIFCALWACTLIPTVMYNDATLGNMLHSGRVSRKSDLANDFNNKSQGEGGPKSFL